jgi:hypothetical protein
MNKPRNVVTVIDKLLKHIPSDEYDLIHEITEYGSTKACWMPLMHILNKNIQDIDQDWKISLVKIVNNE